jgi:hypothetical protein
MPLDIETFSNQTGAQCFFKAVGHPAVVPAARALLARLAAGGPVAVYDPAGQLETFAAIWPLDGVKLAGVFVQKTEHLGRVRLGQAVRPVTELQSSGARTVFVVAFDAERPVGHIRHLVPPGAGLVTLDDMRLPPELVTNRQRYLDGLNFATNFAFFRDEGGHHTAIATANYWHRYGARGVSLHARLMAADGRTLAEWTDPVPDGDAGLFIDSAAVRRRFGLGPFTGQLFLHFVGVKGHDVVKYALDTYGDAPDTLSCTHDANAWPSLRFAGLPAPAKDERVILWVQNSHPVPIPRGGFGLNVMGDERVAWLDREVPGFATLALDTRELLPDCAWPAQIEIQAGKHVVRPRYEIVAGNGRRRIAHPNVEREDLKPNPAIPALGNLMGRGYMLPAPVLPPARFAAAMLPTPMATGQTELPLALAVHDADGNEVALHRFGNLKRRDSAWLDLEPLARNLPSGYGHAFLHYDFAAGSHADGWIHAIFRFRDRASGHAAETSFGSHIFNTALTFGSEPQSYSGPPPGLTTRLFLRLAAPPADTFCHLIYPASTPWHAASDTTLALVDAAGAVVAERRLAIPCNGSRLWHARETFGDALLERARAGAGGYVLIRDTTCRLFGYHGVANGAGAFSLDHMFGF